MERVFCPSCREHHRAKVRTEDGWPTVTWLDPHRDELPDALDQLGQVAGEAFAIAVSKGDLGIAETFADVLARNDPEGGRPDE